MSQHRKLDIAGKTPALVFDVTTNNLTEICACLTRANSENDESESLCERHCASKSSDFDGIPKVLRNLLMTDGTHEVFLRNQAQFSTPQADGT